MTNIQVLESIVAEIESSKPGNGKLVCDLCTSTEPRWEYRCRPFIDPAEGLLQNGILATSDDRWCACNVCHHLIETNDRTTLANRSVDSIVLSLPESIEDRDFLFREMRDLHDLFFLNRIGEATLIENPDQMATPVRVITLEGV